jgi:TetR/AcrR family fatty acid metabolism transcriptional regulator
LSYIENKKADKKKRILQAATKIFSDKGFYNAKISQIADLARVADGTIYLYFNSKDDLLIRIFEDAMNDVISIQTETTENEESAAERLRVFAKNHADYVISGKDLAGLIQLEIRQSNKFMKDYDNRKFADLLNLIADIIVYGQERGEFKSDINRHVAKQAIFGAIDEISTQWIFLQDIKKFDLKKALTSFIEVFIQGLIVK